MSHFQNECIEENVTVRLPVGCDVRCFMWPLVLRFAVRFWLNSAVHDQQTGQQQPAQLVNSTGISTHASRCLLQHEVQSLAVPWAVQKNTLERQGSHSRARLNSVHWSPRLLLLRAILDLLPA